MASIPLPALAIRPPAPQPDPVEQFGRIAALKNMLATAPLQQQRLQMENQTAGLENQQKQQQLTDQQAMTSAMHEWDGQDYSNLPGLVLKHGGSATAVIGLKTNIIKQQQDLANLSKDQLSNEKVKNDYLAQAIDNVKQLPPDQQPAAFESAKAQAVQAGHLDPQHAQAMQYQGPQQLDLLEKSLMGRSASVESALKATETQKASAQAGEAAANTAKIQTEMQLGTGPMADSKYRFIVQQQKLGRPVSPEDKAFVAAYAQQKSVVPTATFNLQNASAPGQGGIDDQMADAVANGKMPLSQAISPRTPISVKQAFMAKVMAIKPDFKSSDFDVEKKVQESMTSGTYSQQLNAISTARNHMGTFRYMVDALNNGDIQIINKAGNRWSQEFGGTAPTNFAVAREAFAGEVGRALAGAGVTLADRQEAGNNISAANSPQQLRGVIDTVDKLLKGKQDALKQTFESGMKAKPNFGTPEQNAGTGNLQIGATVTVRGKQMKVTAVHPDGSFDAK